MSRRRNRDPLLRLAIRLARRPARSFDTGSLARDSEALLGHQQRFEKLWQRLYQARIRGWYAAAARVRHDLLRVVHQIEDAAALVRARHDQTVPNVPPVPRVQDVYQELRQLSEEFEEVDFRLKEGIIAARTEPIVLDEVELGPFEIQLNLKRLASAGQPGSSCFDCVALVPNPAACRSSITHPHVQDRSLCAGEATLPISAALQQGRIFDAFCLVRAVLQTYNATSPYVPLENWEGVSCHDCGHVADRENSSFCEHCGRDHCDECMSHCQDCDSSCCGGCLENDSEADMELCPHCSATCEDCRRTFRTRDDADETGLCPQCRESQEQEQQLEEEEEQPAEAAPPMQHSIVSIPMNPQPELIHDNPHDQRDAGQPGEPSPVASIEPGEQDQSAVAA